MCRFKGKGILGMKQWLTVLFFAIAATSVTAETHLICRYESQHSFQDGTKRRISGEFTASFDEQDFTALNGLSFCPPLISSSVTPYLLKFECGDENLIQKYFTINRISGSFEEISVIKGEPVALFDGECESTIAKRF